MSRKHGPGVWLCWRCFLLATDDLGWKVKWQITPLDYRSRGGSCNRCDEKVKPGDQAMKVMVEARKLWT